MTSCCAELVVPEDRGLSFSNGLVIAFQCCTFEKDQDLRDTIRNLCGFTGLRLFSTAAEIVRAGYNRDLPGRESEESEANRPSLTGANLRDLFFHRARRKQDYRERVL